MKTDDLNELSTSLQKLRAEFLEHVETGLEMGPVEVSRIVKLLGSQQHIALLLETELGAHRISENSRFCRDMIDNIATEQVSSLLIKTDGKIIRPHFGSRNPDGKEPA